MKKYLLFLAFIMVPCYLGYTQNHLKSAFSENRIYRSTNNINPLKSRSYKDNTILSHKRSPFDLINFSWKWDTIISYDASSGLYQRVSRSYNSFGYPLTQLTEQCQNNSFWVNYSMQTWTYDSAGNLPYQTNLIELWQNNAWENSLKQMITFNNNGDQVTWMRAAWDSTGWINQWFYTYKYDSNGLVDSCIFQEGQDTAWVNSKLWLPLYDVNGLMTSEITNTWMNNSWTVTNLETYTYDANGKMLTDLFQNQVNSLWVNNNLQTFIYDIYGNPFSSVLQFWLNNAWKNMSQSFFTFDLSGNMLNEIDQQWSNNTWMNSMQFIYSYDSSNNMTSQTNQEWNFTSWQNQNKDEFTYDSAGNSETGRYWVWNQSETRWMPYVSSLIVFSNHQHDDYITGLMGHRYSMIMDSIFVNTEPITTNCRFTVFPNPTRSIVYVTTEPSTNGQYGSITVYNLQGQHVLSEQLKDQTTAIDVRALNSGIYFIRFVNHQSTKTQKFVKE
jgi:hypothetical protein